MRKIIHLLVSFLFQRRSYTCCQRCGYVYASRQGTCPECSHLDDEALEQLIRVRTENRYFVRQMAVIISLLLTVIAALFYVNGII
jgi:predicted ATP-dependent serine protease